MNDLSKYHPAAKVAFDNSPYARVIYWPFVRANGSAGTQTRVELWDGAAAIALDETTHQVYLIHRKRETSSGVISVIELPNGGIDPGDTPLQTAQQELLEEAGVQAVNASDWVQLLRDQGMQPIDGLALTHQHAFLCLHGRKIAQPEAGETDEVLTMSFEDIIALDNRNGFNDPLTPYFTRRAYDWLNINRPDLIA